MTIQTIDELLTYEKKFLILTLDCILLITSLYFEARKNRHKR